MTRTGTLRFAWVVLLAMTLSSAGFAQVRKTESVDKADTGKIEGIFLPAKTISIRGANGEGGLYHLNDETTIMSGDKKLTMSDLKVGDWISVDSDEHRGSHIATYIEVVDGP